MSKPAARALGDETEEEKWLNNLGLVYADQGEWQRAVMMVEQSLETKERLGDVHGMALTYENLGILYQEQGQIADARANTQKALEIYERLGAPQVEKARRLLAELVEEGARG